MASVPWQNGNRSRKSHMIEDKLRKILAFQEDSYDDVIDNEEPEEDEEIQELEGSDENLDEGEEKEEF